jgi:hypothetical protein
MLQLADLEKPSPAELVALARLADDPTLAPPPHLRKDLEKKGWVKMSCAGFHLLTGRGRDWVESA